jgi:hypothetical protein
MPEKQAELEWEARAGRPVAVIAFAAGAGVIGGLLARASIGRGSSKKAASLRIAHEHSGAILTYSILTAVALLLIGVVLLYLYRVTKFRRPELPVVAAYLAVAGPVLSAVTGVVSTEQFLDAAKKFVTQGPQTEAHAKYVSDHAVSSVVGGLGLAGALTFALGLMLIAVHSMRAGVLSRFMGILGIIYGALQVLPILPGPVIQLFWVTALGVLFLGRWPGGRGPAWETGEATPWPTAAERAQAAGDGEPDEEDEEDGEIETAAPETRTSPNARSRKRKRKARR